MSKKTTASKAAMYASSINRLYGTDNRAWTYNFLFVGQALYQLSYVCIWWRKRDLNSYLSDCKSEAFPIKLFPPSCGADNENRTRIDRMEAYCSTIKLYLHMELTIGLEPTTSWLQVSRSTNWATLAKMAVQTRFELVSLQWQCRILTNWTTEPMVDMERFELTKY